MARRLASRAVAVVVTARDEELVDVPVLRQLLAELASEAHVTHVRLGPLSTDATTALVRALARGGSTDARLARLVRKVLAVSEGNPFVVVETMRALSGRATPRNRPVALPRRVRDMITARLERLTARSRQLAEVAAVIEREFSFALLQQAARFTAPRDRRGRRGAGAATSPRRRRRALRFHPRPRPQRDLRRRPRSATPGAAHGVGEALESAYAGRLTRCTTGSPITSRGPTSPAKAFTYLVHLADKAARSYAPCPEAVRGLYDALRYADRLPSETRERRRLDVVYRLAHVLAPARPLRRGARAAPTSGADGDEPSQSRRSAGPTTSGWRITCGNLGESERAMEHARRALDEATRCDDALTMGQASFALARESYVTGRAQEGIDHGRRAIALLEDRDERWWLGQALFVLAWNLLHVGDFVPALQSHGAPRRARRGHRRSALAILGGVDDRPHSHGHGRWRQRDHRGPARRGARRRSGRAGHRRPSGSAPPIWRTATRSRRSAFLEDAIGQLEPLRVSGGYRGRQMDGLLAALLGEAYLIKGDLERAAALASRAHTAAVVGGFSVAVGYAERALALVAMARGDRTEGESQLRRAIQTFAVGRRPLPGGAPRAWRWPRFSRPATPATRLARSCAAPATRSARCRPPAWWSAPSGWPARSASGSTRAVAGAPANTSRRAPRSRRATSSGMGTACRRSAGVVGRFTHARTSKPAAQSRPSIEISYSMRNVLSFTQATIARMASVSP